MSTNETILKAVLNLTNEVGEMRSDITALKAQDARVAACEKGVSSVKNRQHFLSGAYAAGAVVFGYFFKSHGA